MGDVLLKRNLDPINGGCWFCHKAIENNEEYGFSMEWDAYLPSAEEAVRLTEEELSYAKERCKTNDTMEHDG